MDKITHVIVVTNTWTKKQWIYPEPFTNKGKADEALKRLLDKCSSTESPCGRKFKNNEFQVVPISIDVNQN